MKKSVNEGNKEETCLGWADLTHHSSLKSLRNAEYYSDSERLTWTMVSEIGNIIHKIAVHRDLESSSLRYYVHL